MASRDSRRIVGRRRAKRGPPLAPALPSAGLASLGAALRGVVSLNHEILFRAYPKTPAWFKAM